MQMLITLIRLQEVKIVLFTASISAVILEKQAIKNKKNNKMGDSGCFKN